MRVLKWALILIGASTGVIAMQPSGKQIFRAEGTSTAPLNPAIRAGSFVYVSGMLAQDMSGDIRAQTRQVFERLEAVLGRAGSSLSQVASAVVYLKNAQDFAAMDEVYRGFFASDPPARTTIMTPLARPEALIEIAVTAIPAGGNRQIVLPEGWTAPSSPYSYGVKSGDTLFLSGLVSRSGRDNSVVTGDMKTQVTTIFENAKAILQAGGMGLEDVVDSHVYIRSVDAFQDMNKVYQTFFPKDPPARATVQTGLPGSYDIEITLTAVKGPVTREPITAPAADGTPGTPNPNFSSAIRVGNRLYVSGNIGRGDDIKAATSDALERLQRSLQAGGFNKSDVVKAEVFLTDMSNYAGMNEAYRAFFGQDFPTRATVQTGLVAEGLIEIGFLAVK